MTNTVKLPQLLWYGMTDLQVTLPDNWQMEVFNMAGHDRKALTPYEIRDRVRNPLGSPPIRTLARGKKQVAIIFDDIQRATRPAGIVPFILEELAEAGIPDSSIRFIGATGCHAAMNRLDFVKKLGEEALRRFPVYNHNAFGNCIKVGTTSCGTDIFANAEVMACDLKIAIGSVVPHHAAGFSGGAKIILPGICSFETNQAFHRFAMEFHRQNPQIPVGNCIIENNALRLNMAEAARLVGLDIKIDTLMNSRCETVAVYAGKPEIEFEAAVREARPHYLSSVAADRDIAIANTFAKVGEFECGLTIAYASLKKEGGDVVIICNSPGGHVAHYLFGAWGKAKRPGQMSRGLPANVNHLYIVNEYPDVPILVNYGYNERISLITGWDEALALLRKSYPGKARVAIYPSADIQYYAEQVH